jgi:hypothetical protein
MSSQEPWWTNVQNQQIKNSRTPKGGGNSTRQKKDWRNDDLTWLPATRTTWVSDDRGTIHHSGLWRGLPWWIGGGGCDTQNERVCVDVAGLAEFRLRSLGREKLQEGAASLCRDVWHVLGGWRVSWWGSSPVCGMGVLVISSPEAAAWRLSCGRRRRGGGRRARRTRPRSWTSTNRRSRSGSRRSRCGRGRPCG